MLQFYVTTVMFCVETSPPQCLILNLTLTLLRIIISCLSTQTLLIAAFDGKIVLSCSCIVPFAPYLYFNLMVKPLNHRTHYFLLTRLSQLTFSSLLFAMRIARIWQLLETTFAEYCNKIYFNLPEGPANLMHILKVTGRSSVSFQMYFM
jgi:hypothetical protein